AGPGGDRVGRTGRRPGIVADLGSCPGQSLLGRAGACRRVPGCGERRLKATDLLVEPVRSRSRRSQRRPRSGVALRLVSPADREGGGADKATAEEGQAREQPQLARKTTPPVAAAGGARRRERSAFFEEGPTGGIRAHRRGLRREETASCRQGGFAAPDGAGSRHLSPAPRR